ncbi:MAG: formylglycine-generating enzyme family protein [Candidatus Hydrogenedentota bacterium]|nr:MAG: formylglycine-generating enzyme family protein [Candidatus Hydrogenedentota bacterium]
MPRIAIAVLLTMLLTSLTGCSKDVGEEIVMNESEEVTGGAEDALAISAEAAREMVLIPAGKFIMGSPDDEGYGGERPQHEVSIDSFYMSKHEVTFEQYDLFCEKTGRSKPSDRGWGRGKRPVINVTWYDAVAFCDWLSELSGDRYRLPTEAEWEYACRAGTTTQYGLGDGAHDLGLYAWYSGNAGKRTHPVGNLKANAWGLHDMHGNVWEWCSDWYDESYYGRSPSSNPTGPTNGQNRVRRGGSWGGDARDLRSANRNYASPDVAGSFFGFRCAWDE